MFNLTGTALLLLNGIVRLRTASNQCFHRDCYRAFSQMNFYSPFLSSIFNHQNLLSNKIMKLIFQTFSLCQSKRWTRANAQNVIFVISSWWKFDPYQLFWSYIVMFQFPTNLAPVSLETTFPGLQTISRLPQVKLSGLTYFPSDISHFWPDKH